jgi:alkyldihydroxyacetonephosphate synthase
MVEHAERFVPEPPEPDAGDAESLDVWGFRDTSFRARPDGVVELTGNRYALCGEDLNPSLYPPPIPLPRRHEAFLDEMHKLFAQDQIREDPEVRLRHGHGHTQEEMYEIKYGELPRVPDLVVYPSEEAQIVSLVEAARRHDVCLIPYGGGTNVTDALRCPVSEERSIVSVDLSRMNRILWIDPTNHMACIQAGAVGRHIAEQLARRSWPAMGSRWGTSRTASSSRRSEAGSRPTPAA